MGDLLRIQNQADVSAPVPLPVDRVDDTSVVVTATAETVVWSFLSGSVWAAASGEAAGTICTSKLTYQNILNSINSAGGSYRDTSLALGAATRFDALVDVPEHIFSKMVFLTPALQIITIEPYLPTNGNYAIDHRRGQLWGKSKASVANDTATYDYSTSVVNVGSVVVDSEFPAAVLLTDNFATPTTTVVGAFGMVYDGATWDFMRGTAADGVLVNLGTNNDVTVTSGAITETNSAAIKTAVEIIDNAIAGNEMQVDVLTMPTVTVQATNLDIRDLVFASDKVDVSGSSSVGVIGTFWQATQPISAAALPLPAGASTLAEQQSQTTLLTTIAGDTTDIEAAVELIDDAIYTDGAGTVTKGIAILGQDGTNPQAIKTDSSGELQIDVLTMPAVTVTGVSTLAEQQTQTASLSVLDDWDESDRAKVNPIAGQAGVQGASGTVSANTQRVVLATDVALPTGTNAIGRVGHDITGIGHGKKSVTTAGTDVALAASTACKKVSIQAYTNNTGVIAIGAAGVDATLASGDGIVLYAGQIANMEIDNLSDIFIDSTVNGESVRYTYFT